MGTAFEMVLADVRENPTSPSSVELASDILCRISGRLSGRAWIIGKEVEKATGTEKERLKKLEAKANWLASYFRQEAGLVEDLNPKAVLRAVECHTIFEREKLDNKNYILNRPGYRVGQNTKQRQSSCTIR
jgi:hypothetical protein